MNFKFFLTIIFIILSTFVSAQTPEGMSYQTVVRDGNGSLISNQNVSFRFSILETTSSGSIVYEENHSVTTNDFGLVNLVIGEGNATNGTFEDIEWGDDQHFLKVEVDPLGGSDFTDLGTTQFQSVPYALNAKNVENALWIDIGDTLIITGKQVSIGNAVPPGGELSITNTNRQENLYLQNQSNSTKSPSSNIFANTLQKQAFNTFGFYNRVEADVNNTGSLSGLYNFVVGSANSNATLYGSRSLITSSALSNGANAYCYYATISGTPADNQYSFYANSGNAYFEDRVGIGVEVPATSLHVENLSSTAFRVGPLGNSNAQSYVTINTPTGALGNINGLFRVREDGITKMIVNEDTRTYTFQVFGDAQASGGTWTNSDAKLKDNVQPVKNALKTLQLINPTTYTFKDEERFQYLNLPKEQQFGFMAQDLKDIFPNLVREDQQYNEDGTEKDFTLHSVNYTGLVPVTVRAIQEQQEIIERQQSEINMLRAEMDELKAILSNIDK